MTFRRTVGGYGVGLTVEYPWHRAPRNTLRPQRGQRSGSARLSSGPADRCVPFCPFFEATRGKRAANHQVCSGLPLPTAVVPFPSECAGRAAPAGTAPGRIVTSRVTGSKVTMAYGQTGRLNTDLHM